METKPNPNPKEPTKSTVSPHISIGRDHIVVRGDIGTGSNIGSGSVRARQIAGGDQINVGNGQPSEDDKNTFAAKMAELRDLIIAAKDKGELDGKLAEEALSNLEEAAQLITAAEKPPKSLIIRKLEYIGDILDTASDLLSSGGGVAAVLAKAVPIAALLVKIATRIF